MSQSLSWIDRVVVVVVPEEAEGGHDGLRLTTEGETGGDRADDHDHESHAIDALPAHLVTEPAEEELAGEGTAEGDTIDSSRDIGGQGPGLERGRVSVVDAAEQLRDERDAEEIIGICEEAHPSNQNCCEMVPLGFCCIKCI